MLYSLNDVNTEYNFNSLISGDYKSLKNIYPDDTNLTILNKISVNFYKDTPVNEIFACTDRGNPIGFNYPDPSILMNKIISNNKLKLSAYSDNNFVDQLGNRKNVLINNVLHELFENNFPIKHIYYFSLKELLDLFGEGITDSFIFQVIYKYFPNIQKAYVMDYNSKENVQYRKDNNIKINELIDSNDKIMKILEDNKKNILDESSFDSKLIKFNFIPGEENYINIIKLFSDFPLNSENLITKLILGEHEHTYYKIYKPELKLKLSESSKILDKDICNRLIKDYKDNINIPLNLGYIPTFEQPKNCFIIKSYLSNVNLYYSFVLYKEGNIDLFINNYYDSPVDKTTMKYVVDKANELIDRINRYRISSKNIIPHMNYIIDFKPSLVKPIMQFTNCVISFPMSDFVNNKGVSKYLKKNLLIFLGNFYTHFRIMQEKMDLHLESDDILVHYRRVNNYESMDVIQSIINVLYDPQAALEPSEFIELIHERTNLNIADATREFKKWNEKKSIDSDKKSYSIQTKETGSEIIINKYLDEYIRFQIYNVQSLDELDRIIWFIKIFMKLYSLFVSDKLNASLKQLFMKNNAKKNIIDLQDNLQAIELVDHSQEEGSSGESSDSGSINLDDISDASSSGGGTSSDTSSEKENFKINKGKDSWSYLNSLKNADKDLYKPNKKVEYSKRCTNNEGSRMPIPVSDRKLQQIDKNDILLTATKLNSKNEEVPLTYSERKQYMALPMDKMISKLNSDNINYDEDLKSYSASLEQSRISDNTNINYICPKYWDISRKVPVHPRDIHKYLDNIVSLNFRGETDKFIIDRQGNTKTHDFWKEISNDNLKQEIISKIRGSDTENKKRLLQLDINDFYKEIYSGKYNITNEDLDEIYQKYVNRLAPGFINEKYNVDGYRLPCCFKNKGDKPVITQKKADTNKILLSNLTPCNINLFGHVHVKLQKLFNHDETLQDNLLGGFIKYGVKQNNNSLIYAFANLDKNYKDTLNKIGKESDKELLDRIEQRIIKNYTNLPYTKSLKDVNQMISGIKKEGKDIISKMKLHLLNNHMDYINEIIMPKLTDDNSLFLFMKLGEGNIVQLFKNEEYNAYDIIFFLDYIKKYQKQFTNINIPKTHITSINKSFSKFIKYLASQKININNINQVSTDNAYKFVNGFTNYMNKTENKYNVKFIYDLIISKNNYIEYLLSNEKKDYKYLIPLICEITNKNYMIFENTDESINLRLPLNKYDLSQDVIYHFIYKYNDYYEPIYYYNKSDIPNKIDCDFKHNICKNKDINKYINNILSGINISINSIYIREHKDDLDLVSCINEIYPKYKPKYLLVDNYCKISHIITEDKCIFPIVPTNILKSYKDIKFELIYDFDDKLPSYRQYIKYTTDEDIKNLKRYMKPSGLIIEGGKLVNIVLKNDSYIPIEPIEYNKSTMLKLPILGNTNIYTLDKYVQRFIPENDSRSKYNANISYINHITSLMIQNIIFYLKNETILSEFYTDQPKFTVGDFFPFKIIKKDHEGKTLNFIEKDYYFPGLELSKNISGIVRDIKQSKYKGLYTIYIDVNYLEIMKLISNDDILINFDKQQYLYDMVHNFKDNIVKVLSNKQFKDHINDRNSSICFNNTEDVCEYPCVYDENKCKLYVKETSIYKNDNKLLINKIIWKFVELFMIHKDIDVINNILQNNISISDLYKTKKSNEIFFNYLKYNNLFLDEIFKYSSQFVRDINFYDKNNDTPVSDSKPKNISSILNGIPNIIYKLFKDDASVWFYFGKNIDFLPLEHTFNNLFNEGGDLINYIKIKQEILTEIKLKKKDKEFLKNIKMYFDYGKSLNTLKDYIISDNYKISPFDLEILCNLTNKYLPDIGFLLISSKYSEQTSSKLKHNIIFKYNMQDLNDDTTIILLYHHLNSEGVYDLCNIVVKNEHIDKPNTYDTYMKFSDLYKIKPIKNILNNDYPEIKEKFNI